MPELETCKFKKFRSKLKELYPGQGQIWAFLHSRAINSKTNCTICPTFELVGDTASLKKLRSKLKALYPGQGQIWAFSTQGQVTL